MSKKVRLGDMSGDDRREYKYYQKLLLDLYVYGPRLLEEKAEKRIKQLEEKYKIEEKKDILEEG